MTTPKSWADITIKQYQQLYNVRSGVYDFAIEQEIAILAAITGRNTDDLESLPKSKLVELARVTEFINQPLSDKLKRTFRIGSRKFYIELKPQELTAEQFIILNRYTANEANTIENLHSIMALLTYEKTALGKVRPFDYDFEGKAKLIQERLSIEEAYAPTVFFCKVYSSWYEATQTYLLEKAEKILREAKAKVLKMEQKERTSKGIGGGYKR